MASLIIMKGAGEGNFHRLDPGVNVIGRAADLPFQLADMTVSRRHMEIRFDPGNERYYARDLGSTHGLFLNGRRVWEDSHLVEGDCLSVGRVELVFTKADVASRDEAQAILARTQVEIPTMDYRDSSLTNLGVAGDSTVRPRQHRIRQWAGAEQTTLAVVFTDLIDSALLGHELGNGAMEAVRRDHFAAVRQAVAEHGGYEIKTNGDEFMVAFRTAVKAVDFALDVQAAPGHPRLRVRAAVHIGPVIVEQEDVQGAAVSYAARLLGRARAGGVWVSREVKNHLEQEKSSSQGTLDWQRHPGCELKGFPGRHELWSVNEDL
jgi:class 3 adenylate cyclase